ncbi:MAG: RNA 2',3'-cyclic phosphodiesterase [Candidatus Bathyarchaeota archaeon]|nr:MAG: RNA 2',3'-cyclic phosphodiesterase [Candidatus Bathyarchaeota archaeon]
MARKGFSQVIINDVPLKKWLRGQVMPEMIRSFIAFDMNDESVLRHLSEVQRMLMNTGAGLKLVKTQNIHITMRFLGNISLSMVDSIHEEMKELNFTSLDVEIKGVGAFPSLRYARVVWAGIRKGADALTNIFNQLEPRLRGLGIRPDPKGFSPHLTIARVKTGRHKSELVRCVQDLVDYEFGVIRADCLRLKKSVLTPRGPVYSTMREVCR